MLDVYKVRYGTPYGISSFCTMPHIEKGNRLVAVISSIDGKKHAIDVTNERDFFDMAIFCGTHTGTGYALFVLTQEQFNACILCP